MTAYWVARSKVNDPEGYKRYTDLVPDILKKYGGKALSRGGDYKINEGPEYFNRFILIEFPSMEDAIACFESECGSRERARAAPCRGAPCLLRGM